MIEISTSNADILFLKHLIVEYQSLSLPLPFPASSSYYSCCSELHQPMCFINHFLRYPPVSSDKLKIVHHGSSLFLPLLLNLISKRNTCSFCLKFRHPQVKMHCQGSRREGGGIYNEKATSTLKMRLHFFAWLCCLTFVFYEEKEYVIGEITNLQNV